MLVLDRHEESLSVLCADVVGGARLLQRFEPPEVAYAVSRCEKRIRRAVESHGGCLVKRTDAGLMAFFKGNGDALQSAIEMQHRVSDLPPSAGLPLAVRVGICTGHETREARYFPGEGANPAVSLSQATEPGRILLSVPRRFKIFDQLQLALDSGPDLTLICGKRRLGIFQVGWLAPDQAALKAALLQLGKSAGRLFVRHQGREIILDESRPVTSVGRQPDCDLIMQDSRCSHLHGTIERRLDRFVFVDRSRNGTFVTFENQAEMLVHRKEVTLSGRGQLSFGTSAAAKGADLLQFQNAGLSL